MRVQNPSTTLGGLDGGAVEPEPMSDPNMSTQNEWIAGWIDGVLGGARGTSGPADVGVDSPYEAGLARGCEDFVAREEPIVFVAPRRGWGATGRAILRTATAAAALFVAAGVWSSMNVANRAFAADAPVENATARFHARTPVVELLEVAFSEAPENDRLAALAVLVPRAARGEVDVARRDAFVEMVRREGSPAVALEAAAIARGLS